MLRWLMAQANHEVRSQLECMHLIFGVPRYICSREFRHFDLRSELRHPKSKEGPLQERDMSASADQKITAEEYCTRHTWTVPNTSELKQAHPLSDEPLWQFILRRVGVLNYLCAPLK